MMSCSMVVGSPFWSVTWSGRPCCIGSRMPSNENQ